ncbi:A.superbus venom factor 2, partial [Dissostichus eleginoides]
SEVEVFLRGQGSPPWAVVEEVRPVCLRVVGGTQRQSGGWSSVIQSVWRGADAAEHRDPGSVLHTRTHHRRHTEERHGASLLTDGRHSQQAVSQTHAEGGVGGGVHVMPTTTDTKQANHRPDAKGVRGYVGKHWAEVPSRGQLRRRCGPSPPSSGRIML